MNYGRMGDSKEEYSFEKEDLRIFDNLTKNKENIRAYIKKRVVLDACKIENSLPNKYEIKVYNPKILGKKVKEVIKQGKKERTLVDCLDNCLYF